MYPNIIITSLILMTITMRTRMQTMIITLMPMMLMPGYGDDDDNNKGNEISNDNNINIAPTIRSITVIAMTQTITNPGT